MSKDTAAGDDGGPYKHRLDSTFASVSIRDFDNPEPSIRSLLGPPISDVRRLSFPGNEYVHDDDDDDDEEGDDSLLQSRQLVTDIAREVTALVDEVVQDEASHTASATHHDVATRTWPTRNVTDENIDDCYVDFILCCNPAVSDNCDTAELRKAFRAPPKSDGTMFSIFKLFQLIKRFEEGEIKTWVQLVTELGVERKQDQSSQKLQQYAVRLKRWMHAMHVDAFFEYCLNRLHVYYADIPSHLPSLDDELRDGVPLEEDLALRALVPKYRPKRGRRKADRSTVDSGFLSIESAEKRPRPLLLPATLPNIFQQDDTGMLHYDENQSPFQREDRSRNLDGSHQEARIWADLRMPNPQSFFGPASPHSFDPLQPIISGGQQFRWRPSQNPTGRSDGSLRIRSDPVRQFPSVKRARRSHGPAVSSAWPTSGTSRGGKSRGRPAAIRENTENSYSTFPASTGSLEAAIGDHGNAVSLGPELVSTPAAIEEQLQFSSDTHQTILPPIIHPLEDPAYDHSVEIPPLLERDDLQDDLHHVPLNPYSILERTETIKEQFALSVLASQQGEANITLARAISSSLVDNAMRDHVMRNSESALRCLSMLLGIEPLEAQDLSIKLASKDDTISDVQQLQTEMSLFERYQNTDHEEPSINDLINTDGTVSSPQTIQAPTEHEQVESDPASHSGTYDLSWKIKLGPIEAAVSASIAAAESPHRPPTSREEQRLRDEVDMLFSDLETGNPSPGSFPGSASDLMLNDDVEPPLGPSVDWRSKYFETREKLRKTEEDLEKLKRDLVERVVSLVGFR